MVARGSAVDASTVEFIAKGGKATRVTMSRGSVSFSNFVDASLKLGCYLQTLGILTSAVMPERDKTRAGGEPPLTTITYSPAGTTKRY